MFGVESYLKKKQSNPPTEDHPTSISRAGERKSGRELLPAFARGEGGQKFRATHISMFQYSEESGAEGSGGDSSRFGGDAVTPKKVPFKSSVVKLPQLALNPRWNQGVKKSDYNFLDKYLKKKTKKQRDEEERIRMFKAEIAKIDRKLAQNQKQNRDKYDMDKYKPGGKRMTYNSNIKKAGMYVQNSE